MNLTKKPNLVFVFADQLRYQSCGYAGDTKARTPNIDRLAGEGVSFCNAVSSMPVCSAYRASLFTGKYTTSTGMVINELRMNPNHECLGHCLTKAGYDTGYIGKWHLWANQLGCHLQSKNSFVPPGPYRLGFDGFWAAYNFHHDYYDTYYHTDSPEKIFYGKGVYEPDAQTDLAIEFIADRAQSEEAFALFLSIGTPHSPWRRNNVPEEFYRMFSQVAFPPPPNYKEGFDDPYGDAWSNIKRNRKKLDEWARIYYAMTANLDHNIGRLQETLSERGIEDETIFVFTSDHGEMFGAHGRMNKNIFYEEAARIPFLMKWPGHVPAKQVSDACLSNVDIMPTLLGLLGIEIPEDVEGMDLSHLAKGQSGPEPDFAFLQNTGACASWEDGHEWRAARDKRYTYATYKLDGAELLFDNVKDPFQMNDLVENGDYNHVLQRCRQKLEGKMKQLNDTFETSSWYKENWVSDDRIILRTATLDKAPPPVPETPNKVQGE